MLIRLSRLLKKRCGQGIVEYALLLAFTVAAAVFILDEVGGNDSTPGGHGIQGQVRKVIHNSYHMVKRITHPNEYTNGDQQIK